MGLSNVTSLRTIPSSSTIAIAALVASIVIATTSSASAAANDFSDMGVASPYAAVDARNEGLSFDNLPGFTRGAYERDHALITPESRVYTGLFGWKNTNAAWLVTPAMHGGPQFSMYQALMRPDSESGVPVAGAWRFVFVMDGEVFVTEEKPETKGATTVTSTTHTLRHGGYAYFPADHPHKMTSTKGASLLIYEKQYVPPSGAVAAALGPDPPTPTVVVGHTDDQPHIPTPGEVFGLKKLLPQTLEWDVNFHVMDFNPGEHLYVKEIHYNQHGLMLLEGKGIYRLNDKWYSVQAGDVIWMAPYVTQWYAALGYNRSRYIILKDTNRDPIQPYTPGTTTRERD